MSHRKPPLSAPRPGWCRWCDLEIPPRRKRDGTPHATQASMHAGCSREYFDAQNVSLFRDRLIERDGKACGKCGEAPHSWGPRHPPSIVYQSGYDGGPACEVEWRLMLDVDHVVPLWKVTGLPVVRRRQYFKIGNLQLLCRGGCHKRKSAKEAAERAHHKRLAKPKKRRGPKLQGWGWDKRLHRRMDGSVEERTVLGSRRDEQETNFISHNPIHKRLRRRFDGTVEVRG